MYRYITTAGRCPFQTSPSSERRCFLGDGGGRFAGGGGQFLLGTIVVFNGAIRVSSKCTVGNAKQRERKKSQKKKKKKKKKIDKRFCHKISNCRVI